MKGLNHLEAMEIRMKKYDRQKQMVHCRTCSCYVAGLGDKFSDKYGDTWLRISNDLVLRLRDGTIGKWSTGQGLVPNPN